ncbi:phosphatase PAP2 family protein [Jatrophihabitans sp. YIM 134969]
MALLVVAVPMASIVVGVQRGRWTDHHVAERRSRTAPLLVAVACVIAAVLLLALADASRAMLAVVIAMLVGLLAVLVVNHWWKTSIHAAVAGGLLAVLVVTFGPWLFLGVSLVTLVAWSRVALDYHTVEQAVAGAVLGAAVAATVFPALR